MAILEKYMVIVGKCCSLNVEIEGLLFVCDDWRTCCDDGSLLGAKYLLIYSSVCYLGIPYRPLILYDDAIRTPPCLTASSPVSREVVGLVSCIRSEMQ